jgi:hypothetical protein
MRTAMRQMIGTISEFMADAQALEARRLGEAR